MPTVVEIYGSSISGNREIKRRQQYLDNILPTLGVPFIFKDLAADEEAKSYFRRKNQGHNDLPGLFSGGEWRGTWQDFETSVEDDRVHEFFKLDHEDDDGEIDYDSIDATQEEIQRVLEDLGIDDDDNDTRFTASQEDNLGVTSVVAKETRELKDKENDNDAKLDPKPEVTPEKNLKQENKEGEVVNKEDEEDDDGFHTADEDDKDP